MANVKEIIEDKEIREKYVNIKINMTGNSIEYFYDKKCSEPIENTVSIKKRK